MTDQQFLGVKTVLDEAEIKNVLIKKITDLDFEIDIEKIFNYINCYQRLIQKTETTIQLMKFVITDEYNPLIVRLSKKIIFRNYSKKEGQSFTQEFPFDYNLLKEKRADDWVSFLA
jgi:hypothetical protein